MKKICLSLVLSLALLAGSSAVQAAEPSPVGDTEGTIISGSAQAVPVELSQPDQEALAKAKNIPLRGKVQVVNSFPDYKVQIVNSFPDLKVKAVNGTPSHDGEWQFVNSFPDFKVQYVNSFPDFKIQFVDSFPGLP